MRYDTVYGKLRAYFTRVLAVDYHVFAESPAAAMERICGFVGIDAIHRIDFRPVNTSAERIASRGLSRLAWTRFVVPGRARTQLRRLATALVRRSSDRAILSGEDSDLARLLPVSTGEYARFRSSVGESGFSEFPNTLP